MVSSTVIHCSFDVAFIPRGVISRSQLCLPRKLVFCQAKQLDSVLNGSVREERGSIPVDVVENFPRLADIGKSVVPVPAERKDARRLRAILRVSVPGPSGSLPPNVLYLLEIGFDHEHIKEIARKSPSFAYCSLEGKIRPLIEFLLDLGVPKSDLPNILIRSPGLCGMRLSENLIPSMKFLETLGVDKTKWVKLITLCPGTLTYSRKKIEATIQYLREVGLSEENIGKILTRCPQILCHSIEDKLRPSAEYFQSLGVEVTVVLRCCPQIMNLSIEANLKPYTEFFLKNGFSVEEVGTMISRFGALYSYSLKANVIPKWEFFLTMGYPRQDLVKHPQYFGYSMEGRIKPRYNLIKESGVKFSLYQLLGVNNNKFESLLKKKIEKLQLDEFCN